MWAAGWKSDVVLEQRPLPDLPGLGALDWHEVLHSALLLAVTGVASQARSSNSVISDQWKSGASGGQRQPGDDGLSARPT